MGSVMERLTTGSSWQHGVDGLWQLSDDEVLQLGEVGFFVRDDFVEAQLVRRARADIEQMAAAEQLRPAGVSRGDSFRLEQKTRGDLITWLDPREATPSLAQVHAHFEALRDELNQAAYLGLDYFEVQIAQYPGGGAGYDRHVDAFPGSVNRRVTAILYLNEGWTPEQGGVLRAWLPGEELREVEPVAGRLVCFMSDQIPHQVLPTYSSRCAITAWYRPRTALL